MVFIPIRRKWVSHCKCVWSTGLGRFISINQHYSDCSDLFTKCLGIKPAGIPHVMKELCFLADEKCEPHADRFKQLFALLSRFSAAGTKLTDKQVKNLRAAPMFPVILAKHSSRESSKIKYCSLEEGGWYIPDNGSLRAAFCGKV